MDTLIDDLVPFGKFLWVLGIALLITWSIFQLWTLWIPKFLIFLATKHKFIAAVRENHWYPIQVTGKFIKGFACKKGHRTGKEQIIEKGDPIFSNNYVINLFQEWLFSKGFIWLGWQSPTITNIGTRDISVTKLPEETVLKSKSYNELPACVRKETVVINGLRMDFTLTESVLSIELSDTSSISAFARADIKIIDPYLFWYGNGGSSFSIVSYALQETVRNAFEQTDLLGLLFDENNAEDRIEVELSKGLPESITKQTGAQCTGITIIYWDYVASKGTAEKITALQQIEIEIEFNKQDAEKQIEKLKLGEGVAKAEKALALVQQATVQEQWKTLLALAGGEKSVALRILSKQQLGDHGFVASAISEAISQFKGQTLVLDPEKINVNIPTPTQK